MSDYISLAFLYVFEARITYFLNTDDRTEEVCHILESHSAYFDTLIALLTVQTFC